MLYPNMTEKNDDWNILKSTIQPNINHDKICFQANKTLQDENEELNAQLLARAVQEGHHMLQEGSSLADELEHLTKEEVILRQFALLSISSGERSSLVVAVFRPNIQNVRQRK